MAKEDIYNFGPSDDFINSQAEMGQKTYEKQRYGRPQFGFPDISQDQVDRSRLLNVLLGAGAGVRASEGAAHPLAAIALGLGGGIQTGHNAQAQQQAAMIQRQKAEAQAAEDQLNMTPVGQVSPGMAKALKEKYGMDISDIPMGQFQKFSGLLQHSQDLENKMALIQARATQAASRGAMSPEARKLLSEISGIPEDQLPSKISEATGLGLTPKPMSTEMLKTASNIADGASDLRRAIEIYDRVDDKTRKLAAVKGVTGRAVRIANEDAQALNRLVGNAADVLTRQRTGAGLNQNEEAYYGNLLNDFYRSGGQNREALVNFLAFYDKIQTEIQSGQRGPGTHLLQRGRQQATATQGAGRVNDSPVGSIATSGGKRYQKVQGGWKELK